MAQELNFDVLVIGSGGAGLSLALKMANPTTHVAVLSKFALVACSTFYAQGGISAVFDADDSLEAHLNDTLNAGAGLCDIDIVKLTVKNGKKSIGCVNRVCYLLKSKRSQGKKNSI